MRSTARDRRPKLENRARAVARSVNGVTAETVIGALEREPVGSGSHAKFTRSLETEVRDTGIVYSCLPGQHDDLGMSCAMLAWAIWTIGPAPS